ncbi:MAG: hypothetical protein GEU26_09450 [Nitrososphaeraceae archaeon]|nr:hypothetical protein [Nitrososphaeraceae archaeon]
MKKEAKESTGSKKVMAYININKRVTELTKMEFLEELKPDLNTVNIHGRRDYKITMKGLEQLIPRLLEHPEEIENIIRYMGKFGLDKEKFLDSLFYRLLATVSTLQEYMKRYSFEITIAKDGSELEQKKSGLKEILLRMENEKLRANTEKIHNSLLEISEARKRIDKFDMTIEELSKYYGNCETCAKFSLEFPNYIVSHPDGKSNFKEPRYKNEKLFLGQLKKFLDHYDEKHMNKVR